MQLDPTGADTHAVPDLEHGLKELGFSGFRIGQREAVHRLLEERRILLVAPTGGGKSLIYQLPAVLLSGITVVVSPLIALMHDQVASLQARGVGATYLAATLRGDEIRRRMRGIAQGEFKLVYVAPERLVHGGFRELVSQLRVALVAVDEAHCISEWGHDFRPEYLQIGAWIEDLNPPRVLACTATATPIVRDEILARLGLPATTRQIVRGFARPNLALQVHELRFAKERHHYIDDMLGKALGEPGNASGTAILYCPTRRTCQDEARRLAALGWRAHPYHAGMDGVARERVQQEFRRGAVDVVAATNAFGMGIDRSDVRAVIHYAPPGSIEAYYQQVGRAGRDGKDAYGLMLYTPADVTLRRRLLERSDEGPPDPAVVEHKWNLFLELLRWAEGGSCRHDAILRYFGDDEELLAGCGHCDVCTSLDADQDDPAEVDQMVRKALSGVARVHGALGMTAAAKLLRGDRDPRLTKRGLDRTTTFGVMQDRSEAWIMKLLRRCVTAGWVDFSGDPHPIVYLTHEGKEVMRGRRPVRLLLPRDGDPTPNPNRSSQKANEGLDLQAQRVFEALRRHRIAQAKLLGVPPYVIASDRTLRDIAVLQPQTPTELAIAHGIGPMKLERYGEGFLQVVAETIGQESR